jgi:hypothetical protein
VIILRPATLARSANRQRIAGKAQLQAAFRSVESDDRERTAEHCSAIESLVNELRAAGIIGDPREERAMVRAVQVDANDGDNTLPRAAAFTIPTGKSSDR